METGNSHEKFKEVKEFSFEDALKETARRIKDLLESQKYVAVAVGGLDLDDANVGKSYFSAQLAQGLFLEKIPTIITNDTSGFIEPNLLPTLKTLQRMYEKEGGVVIFGASGMPLQNLDKEQIAYYHAMQDLSLQKTSQYNSEIKLSKMDVRVVLYRPEQQPQKMNYDVGDIFIKNDKAKIKL